MYRHGNVISNFPLNFVQSRGIRLGNTITGKGICLDPGRLERHMLVVGKTGSGKTNFLKGLIDGIISREDGSVILLDPHGNLAKEAACTFPGRTEIISPLGMGVGESRLSISLNAIRLNGSSESNNIAAGWVKDAFASEGVFSRGTWGPRLEVVFTSILQELMRKGPDSTLADLLNLLLDSSRVRRFISGTENAELKAFLRMQVSDWKGWNQYVTSSINKLLPLLTDEGIRRLISGKEDSFNLHDLFTGESRLVIPEIWMDTVPDDSFKIISMLLILKLWLQRIQSNTNPHEKPIYMVFDEAQLIPGGILDRLLREGRKFGFRIIMATQYLGSGMDSLSETIRGNVGNVVSFNLFEKDSKELSSNFFSGNLQRKLQDVLKSQPVHNAVVWSQDEAGISGPLSFSPFIMEWKEDQVLFRQTRESSLRRLGSEISMSGGGEKETDLHEFLILRFQDYLTRKGIESDRHQSFRGIFPDLYFEHNSSTVFVEVEVSDLVNMGRVAEKIVNYSGKRLVFITPPGESSSLYRKILKYMDSSGLKAMEKLAGGNRDILSGLSIIEYDNGFFFLAAGRLRKLRIEHLSQGTFSRTLGELPFGEIRSFIYGLMVHDGMVRMEFPERKLEKVFGSENCRKSRAKLCSNSSLVSLHDLFAV